MKYDRTKTGLIGKRVGSMTVVAWERSGHSSFWRVMCDCGRESVKSRSNLSPERARGCGYDCPITRRHLATSTTHCMTKHPAYVAWRAMKYRCSNPNCLAWQHYGGRGIGVCNRWADSFENFWEDMGATWRKGLTLDRTNNEEGYSSENCRWVSQAVNARNRRGMIVTAEQREKAYSLGIRVSVLGARIRSGWSIEKAISTPMRPRRR